MTTPRAVTVVQAAEQLGVSRHAVYAWIRQGRLGYVQLGRAIRVPNDEIARILAAGFRAARTDLTAPK